MSGSSSGMLLICYGIPKSGSTLAYEPVRGVVESAGRGQQNFYTARTPKANSRAKYVRKFMGHATQEGIARLLEEVDESRMAVIKTHSGLTDDLFFWLEDLQARRHIQIIASYRDPRDICLSLRDAGVAAVRAGAADRKPFSAISSLAKARKRVRTGLTEFRSWASVRGTLRLDYDVVAFSPDTAIDAIEETLSDQVRSKACEAVGVRAGTHDQAHGKAAPSH